MKKTILLLLMFCALFLSFVKEAKAQTEKPMKNQSKPDKNKPKIIARPFNESKGQAYDGGTVRFLATSEETNGTFSLFELTETSGYKTAWHQHNDMDEAFYVIEGVLTIKINDKVADYPPGSYVLIPRGTPHGQANVGKVPTKILVTFTPSAYEEFFRNRVELFKTVKPNDPKFLERFNELRRKNSKYLEILGTWDLPK